MTPRVFCTYFDHRYLPQGLALYESLTAHAAPFTLWILSLDEPCRQALARLALPSVQLITPDELEQTDPELAHAKRSRTPIEYYFTCTPALCLHLLTRRAEIPSLTYLDADLYFFADPSPIEREIGDASIAIIGHRFPPALRHLEQYGIFNVGWVTIQADEEGLACVRWWREQCLAWCHDRVEAGRFADQKYLDEWPTRFRRVTVVQHKGANLAPWNLANYQIRWDGTAVQVDADPLLFFHFHGLRRRRRWLYDPQLARYTVTPSPVIRQQIYAPYLHALQRAARQLRPLQRLIPPSPGLRGNSADRQEQPSIHDTVRQLIHDGRGWLRGDYFLTLNGAVL